MENQLSYVFMLSLKEISLRRLAVSLWNEPDIIDSIEKFSDVSKFYCVYPAYWRDTVERKVTNNVSKLRLPKALAEELLLIVAPVGLQMKQWKDFHESYLKMPGSKDGHVGFDAPTLAKVNWTTAGTVNYKATAEELIRYEMVDVVKRYTLACLYCLEDCIEVLFEELPEELKRKFYNEDISEIERLPNLEFCWPYILKGEQSRLDCRFRRNNDQSSFNQCVFTHSACCGNKAASEYFFRKLTPDEKEASFIRRTALIMVLTPGLSSFCCFPFDKSCDALCYLLSLMNQEQQMEFFNVRHIWVLRRFLSWPWQDVFLKIADLFWNCPAGEQDYVLLLHFMGLYFENSKYYFPKLFQKFFTRSPVNFRKRFVDKYCGTRMSFPQVSESQDLETMKVVFRNLDEVDRLRIVCSNNFVKFLYDCTFMRRWSIVEMFLQETIQSKDGKEKLREAFLQFMKRRWRIRPCERECFKKFLELLDEMGGSAQNKRCLEDGALNEAKKLASDK